MNRYLTGDGRSLFENLRLRLATTPARGERAEAEAEEPEGRGLRHGREQMPRQTPEPCPLAPPKPGLKRLRGGRR
jgi:hypothetical protein